MLIEEAIGGRECVAVCYSVWQCVAVCGSVLQCVLQCVAVHVEVCCSACCSVLQCVASQVECAKRDVLIEEAIGGRECVAVCVVACCSVLQRVAMCCSVCCNVLRSVLQCATSQIDCGKRDVLVGETTRPRKNVAVRVALRCHVRRSVF